jgi:hypothetical protein
LTDNHDHDEHDEHDEYDDLEFDKYLHSARWWDAVYAELRDDPALVGVLLPLRCAFCDKLCDDRDNALHLKVQLAREPGAASMVFAHVDCFVGALHAPHEYRMSARPPKLYYLPTGEEYHATPQCPEIPASKRRFLEANADVLAESVITSCERCCPVDLVIPRESAYRLPVVFHADDDCPDLPEGVGRDGTSDEWIRWPSHTYHRIVTDNGDAWKRCRRCVPDPALLYPLGSPERAAVV